MPVSEKTASQVLRVYRGTPFLLTVTLLGLGTIAAVIWGPTLSGRGDADASQPANAPPAQAADTRIIEALGRIDGRLEGLVKSVDVLRETQMEQGRRIDRVLEAKTQTR